MSVNLIVFKLCLAQEVLVFNPPLTDDVVKGRAEVSVHVFAVMCWRLHPLWIDWDSV
ncbi:hypothetical protein EXN66_Car010981 [Channa argus]|uniref:Uncharacterized protein n=1 Tax=Channa argus TaxID=215402 RepID=A0A6G1PYE8_CHAAH|nr:hypothetical protein EXN66_Car010981 [Channa argus]